MTVTLQATFVATLVDEWVRGGVTDAVVCPGSRSTPLALAIAEVAAAGRLRLHVFLDERSAGFFAVGLGLASGRPAVVVTTSGTAAVELHPSVVEASQAGVPMIVCTADRPPELHSVGAPQTVDQTRVFGSSVRWFLEPGAAGSLPPSTWRSLASRLVVESLAGAGGPGPVHANLAFRDPLAGDAGDLPAGRAGGVPWHAAVGSGESFGPGGVRLAMGANERGLFVAGHGCDAATVMENAAVLGWPILADPRSGCSTSPLAVRAFDSLLRCDDFVAANVPQVVVRVGSPPASKVLGQWLDGLPDDVRQILVDGHGRWPDPERRASTRLPAIALLQGDPRPATPWSDSWQAAERAAQQAIDAVLDAVAGAGPSPSPTEPGTIRRLTRDLPKDTTIFVSSSMPIRDVEWFGHPASTHRVLANRGANGIDGILSTALGVASADPDHPVVAVTGDLAFLYDAGALLWAAERAADLTIVVLDNGGGGIFAFLPQRDVVAVERFDRLFTTPHGRDLAAIASAYGVPVFVSVDDALAAGPGVRVAVVHTDREANVALHARLHDAVASAIRDGRGPQGVPGA